MFKLPMEDRSGPVEVDASTLTPDEWFAVYAMRGLAPDTSNLDRIAELQKRMFAMSPMQKQHALRAGMESLIARGLVGPAVDKDGKPQTDANGDVYYEVKGKLIYRVRSINTPATTLKS